MQDTDIHHECFNEKEKGKKKKRKKEKRKRKRKRKKEKGKKDVFCIMCIYLENKKREVSVLQPYIGEMKRTLKVR